MRRRLVGATGQRDAVGACLDEAGEAIRSALDFNVSLVCELIFRHFLGIYLSSILITI